MIRSLRLQNFKNFRDATLNLGPFTVIVGTNASGKSNIRDAFRFLHGMSRGYTLADIFGGKYVGGDLEWQGIRGGFREVTLSGQDSFKISTDLGQSGQWLSSNRVRIGMPTSHAIEVVVGGPSTPARVVSESLHLHARLIGFETTRPTPAMTRSALCNVRLLTNSKVSEQQIKFRLPSNQPLLTQVAHHSECPPTIGKRVTETIDLLESIRFLDLVPDAMRIPSLPGSNVLGDRGENLSSVLLEICEDAAIKSALMEWLKQLTPLDVVDFEFIPDQQGKVLVTLVESDGKRTSAYSASDGTLRFLAVIAALLAPTAAKFYFFEEIDNGIHPTRLHLLLQLIEQQVAQRGIQVVATTHSPQLLAYLNEESRQHAALVYRNEGEHEGHITSIIDIPGIQEVMASNDLGKLMATGWLEDAVAFMADGAVS